MSLAKRNPLPVYKEPIALAGVALALTGLVVNWKNTFPGANPHPCFHFDILGGPTTPEEKAKRAQDDIACAMQKRATVGKVVAGVGIALVVVGIVKASRKAR